jgi:endonuclease/exonuclease/phosphatase family metal-dependent hydrolase
MRRVRRALAGRPGRWAMRIAPLLLALAACAAVEAPAQEVALRAVSYNIRHGRGMDDSVRLVRTAGVLRALAPDLVGLQEVDDRVRRSGGHDQAAILGALLGMHHAFGAFMEYQGGRYGMAILSRHPIVRSHAIALPDGNEPRVALSADLRLPDGSVVRAINVHFDWVADDGFRFSQASALAAVLDTMTVPWVLLGDFNDVRDSRTLALFRARAVEAMKPEGARTTFPSADPEREIDYLFVAPAARWRVEGARVVDERVASDHRPVVVELSNRAGRIRAP